MLFGSRALYLLTCGFGQEYQSEGVAGSPVAFPDNRPVLDLFLARPLGLLALLDEESRFPRASGRSLVGEQRSGAAGTTCQLCQTDVKLGS